MTDLFWQGKRVLLTGGTGFIGSHLVRELLRRRSTLLLLTHHQDVPWRLSSILADIKCVPWNTSLNLTSLLQEFDPEFIFHLASRLDVGRSIDLIEEMMEINVTRTLILAKEALASAKSLKLFVNTGTCEEYGDLQAPFSEWMRERPVSPYSLGKTLAAQTISFLSRIAKLPAITVRPFTTYGGWQVADMLIPQVITHMIEGKEFSMSAGEQTRDFIYVEDVADAYLYLSEFFVQHSDVPSGDIFNIATGVESGVRSVVEEIVGMMGGKNIVHFGSRPVRSGEPVHFFADVQKISRTGWKAKTSLSEGLSRTTRWYLDHYSTFRNDLFV